MNRRRAVHPNPQPGTGSPGPGEPVFVVIGKLRRPHGIQGEMLMDVLTDFPERLRRKKVVYVGEQHEPLTLSAIRPQDRAMLVMFEGLENFDAIGRLRNQMVYVKISELPKLPDGEYYYHELIDMRIVDDQGRELGVLSEILETGANDVYVITSPSGEEILLPVISGVVLNIDPEQREIRVHPPEWS